MSDGGHTERLQAALDGKYRIERKLGEGGMASVYLAEDLKHERKVALKILRPELAAVIGAERFLSEIKTTANLQHPHILPLFDSGEAGGYLYYVMPYIDGETLRQKLDREKQLGVEESVRIARDVADALDYAHRHGVIHRDIKPGNILLHDGRAVVADFGIALAVSAAGGGRMTETGLSLGTPHYMSPEQASADRDLSARSDVYSLGCVLYEMLAGQPPHTGPSAQSILVHILTEEPKPLTALRHTVPPNVASAVAKSIEKLPADRFESAKDFVRALGEQGFRHQAGAGTTSSRALDPADGVVASATGPWNRLSVTLAALLGVSIAFGGWALLRQQPPDPVSRYTLSDRGWAGAEGGLARQAAISPDGSTWILPIRGNEDTRLAFKARASTELTPIPDTEGAHSVAFSPDGDWILYGQGTNLLKRPLIGGATVTLAEDTESPTYTFGVAWLDDGTILYEDYHGGPMRHITHLSVDGEPISVFFDDGRGFSTAWISGLPGARGALVTGCVGSQGCQTDENDLFVLDLEDGSVEPIVEQVVRAWYVPTGHIVYVRADGAVFAVPFDAGSRQVTGQATPLFDGVRVNGASADMVLGADGTALYWEGSVSQHGQTPVWVGRDGSEVELDPLLSGEFSNPAVSPDGRMIAFQHQVLGEDNSGVHVWVYAVDQGTLTRLTFEGAPNRDPFWSPDGLDVGFSSTRNGRLALYSRPVDMSDSARLLVSDSVADLREGRWTPDGRSLVYRRGDGDVVLKPAATDSAAIVILGSEARERNPSVSHDGRWLAYVANESGQDEVYVRPLARQGGRTQVSVGGGQSPVWAPDGELLYSSGNALIAATTRTAPELGVERREQLFSLEPYLQSATHPQFDVAPDGERILAITRGDRPDEPLPGGEGRFVVVEKFFDELRQSLVGN